MCFFQEQSNQVVERISNPERSIKGNKVQDEEMVSIFESSLINTWLGELKGLPRD